MVLKEKKEERGISPGVIFSQLFLLSKGGMQSVKYLFSEGICDWGTL
jgi:hypothetical protein